MQDWPNHDSEDLKEDENNIDLVIIDASDEECDRKDAPVKKSPFKRKKRLRKERKSRMR